MAGENTKVYFEQGGDKAVVKSGGAIQILTGGKITPNSGTQAAAIVTVTGGSTTDAEARTAVNAILVALRGVGIIAP